MANESGVREERDEAVHACVTRTWEREVGGLARAWAQAQRQSGHVRCGFEHAAQHSAHLRRGSRFATAGALVGRSPARPACRSRRGAAEWRRPSARGATSACFAAWRDGCCLRAPRGARSHASAAARQPAAERAPATAPTTALMAARLALWPRPPSGAATARACVVCVQRCTVALVSVLRQSSTERRGWLSVGARFTTY